MENSQVISMLANQYEDVKKEGDRLISQIIEDCRYCNPLLVLQLSNELNQQSFLNLTSEHQMDGESALILRKTEYIQSIYASIDISERNEDDALAMRIIANVEKLYELFPKFLICWSFQAALENVYSQEDIEYITQAELMRSVRGKRYQFQQLDSMQNLILAQNDLIHEACGISASEVIEGLRKLEYALSAERLDSIKSIYDDFLSFQEEMKGKKPEEVERWFEIHSKDGHSIAKFEKSFGLALYDVKKVTGWPDILIQSMSQKINECKSFISDAPFSGWPFLDLPVQKKPFLIVDETAYCFDYYNLFDNFYRIIQKAICHSAKENVHRWQENQKSASEQYVADLFAKLIPESEIHTDNYYPVQNTTKQMDENDIIILYEDVIMIIEVKAGSFTYTSAITDVSSHKKSFESLIGKADYQCKRTNIYIDSNPIATFYNEKKEETFSIDSSKYRKRFNFTITVDNFESFETQIEKIKYVNVKDGTISLCIDDLHVYATYFDDPLEFIHFLVQRKAATEIPKLVLMDELDHLGLYISCNMYPLWAKEQCRFDNIFLDGFREELDEYFAGLYNHSLQQDKPKQKMPELFKEILTCINGSDCPDRLDFSLFLRDFSSDTRKQFIDGIQTVLAREKETGNTIPFVIGTGVILICYVSNGNAKLVSKTDQEKYIWANLINTKKEYCWAACVSMSDANHCNGIKFRRYCISQVDRCAYSREELEKYALEIVQKRVAYKKVISHQKTYPNDPCPCGSGKKYKRCCKNKMVY